MGERGYNYDNVDDDGDDDGDDGDDDDLLYPCNAYNWRQRPRQKFRNCGSK